MSPVWALGKTMRPRQNSVNLGLTPWHMSLLRSTASRGMGQITTHPKSKGRKQGAPNHPHPHPQQVLCGCLVTWEREKRPTSDLLLNAALDYRDAWEDVHMAVILISCLQMVVYPPRTDQTEGRIPLLLSVLQNGSISRVSDNTIEKVLSKKA